MTPIECLRALGARHVEMWKAAPLDIPAGMPADLRGRSFTRWGSDFVHFVVHKWA